MREYGSYLFGSRKGNAEWKARIADRSRAGPDKNYAVWITPKLSQ
jgi:hypothetical protein